jgi:hypothetical protein
MRTHIRLLPLFASLGFTIGACGDSTSTAIDAAKSVDATSQADANTSQPDAKTCNVANYPKAAGSVDLTIEQPIALTLDGNGERCDQILRALMSTAARPAPLAAVESGFAIKSCAFDNVINAEIVRLEKTTFANKPLYGGAQDILAHVTRGTNNLRFLAGRIIPATAANGVNSSCLSMADVRTSVPGQKLGYQKFEACQLRGPGEYTIADDDTISVSDEGWFVDSDDNLRRVLVAPVFLLPAHVTPEIINSDAFCCVPGNGVANCVGGNLIFDAVNGALLAQTPNCHTC